MSMRIQNLSDFPGISAESGAEIRANELVVLGRAALGKNVRIEAERVVLGDGCSIEREVVIRGLGVPMKTFQMGDESLLGHSCQVLVPEFFLGDYSQIHHSSLMSGYQPLELGHNCWVGQQSILNSTENLKIGNNVRIGTHSQLWTHVASGELLEGCLLYGQKPLTLEDDVWIVGGAVISPGLILRRKTVVLAGSVLTDSTEVESVYGGTPARPMGQKLRAWRSVTLDEKWAKLKEFCEDYFKLHPQDRSSIHFFDSPTEASRQVLAQPEQLVFFRTAQSAKMLGDIQATVFDLEKKKYSKQRSSIEKRWIKFHVGFRARFLPADQRLSLDQSTKIF